MGSVSQDEIRALLSNARNAVKLFRESNTNLGLADMIDALCERLSGVAPTGEAPVAWRWKFAKPDGSLSNWIHLADEPDRAFVIKEPLYTRPTPPTEQAGEALLRECRDLVQSIANHSPRWAGDHEVYPSGSYGTEYIDKLLAKLDAATKDHTND